MFDCACEQIVAGVLAFRVTQLEEVDKILSSPWHLFQIDWFLFLSFLLSFQTFADATALVFHFRFTVWFVEGGINKSIYDEK